MAIIPQLGVSVTVNVSLTVVPLPVVSVSPLSLSVQTGGAVILTCSVQNFDPNNMATTLEWVEVRDVLLTQKRKFVYYLGMKKLFQIFKFFMNITYRVYLKTESKTNT